MSLGVATESTVPQLQNEDLPEIKSSFLAGIYEKLKNFFCSFFDILIQNTIGMIVRCKRITFSTTDPNACRGPNIAYRYPLNANIKLWWASHHFLKENKISGQASSKVEIPKDQITGINKYDVFAQIQQGFAKIIQYAKEQPQQKNVTIDFEINMLDKISEDSERQNIIKILLQINSMQILHRIVYPEKNFYINIIGLKQDILPYLASDKAENTLHDKETVIKLVNECLAANYLQLAMQKKIIEKNV